MDCGKLAMPGLWQSAALRLPSVQHRSAILGTAAWTIAYENGVSYGHATDAQKPIFPDRDHGADHDHRRRAVVELRAGREEDRTQGRASLRDFRCAVPP